MDEPTTSTYLRKPTLFNGGGGLVGTTADYVRFCTMLARGGALDGRRVLSRKTLELMTANHLPGDGDMSDFALPMGYGEVGFAGNGFASPSPCPRARSYPAPSARPARSCGAAPHQRRSG